MNTFFYDSYSLLIGGIVIGVALGAVFDFFRILRISRKRKNALQTIKIPMPPAFFAHRSYEKMHRFTSGADTAITFIEDVLFFLICAASYNVKVGDIIEVSFGEKKLRVRVTDIREHTLKNEAVELYEVID